MPHLSTRTVRTSLAALLLAGTIGAGLPAATAIAAESPGDLVSNMTGAYLSGRSATAQRDVGNAAAFFSMALQGDPMNPSLTERSLMLWISKGDVPAAVDMAKRLIVLDPTNEPALLTLIAGAFASGDAASALPFLDRLDGNPLAVVTAGVLTGWAEQAAGDTDQALKTIAELEGPEWFGLFKSYHAGLINEAAGRPEPALVEFRRAYDMDPSVKTAESYARLLARTGDRTTAEQVLVDFIGGAPNQPTASQLLADIKAGADLPATVATPNEGVSEMLFAIATALTGDGGQELSTIYLQLAVYLNPANVLAVVSLGQLLQAGERHDDAIALYATIPETSPAYRVATVQRAISLDIMEETEQAVSALRDLVARDPNDTAVLLALGNVLRGHERFEESAEAYTQAVATIPTPVRNDWTLFYFRGIAYERSKQWPLAEADFQKALELFPDQPQVLNYLGYSWVDLGMTEHYDEALAMIEKAVELRPQDGYIVDSLGWAHYQLGDFASAVVELERAVELMPYDPTINDHLGDALWKVGRKLEAVYQWSHARDLDPEPADLATILGKLQNGLPEDADKPG